MVVFDSLLLIGGSVAFGLAMIFFGLRGAIRIWKSAPSLAKGAGQRTREVGKK